MEKSKVKKFLSADDVETWVLPWGSLALLSKATDVMTAGVVTCFSGKGHERHDHSNTAEILFVIEGEGEQTIEVGGKIEKQKIKKGDLVQIPEKVFHSTINTGKKPLRLLAVYQFAQPLDAKAFGVIKVKPAKNKSF